MDIQKTAAQLIKYLGSNPKLIQQFIDHPYSTCAKATGSDAQISRKDMSQVVTAAAALANNQKLGAGDIANIAAALLGQNNNSVHSMTNMLFGGSNAAQSQAQAQGGSLNLGSLVSMAAIAAALMGGMQQAQQSQQAQQQAAAQQAAAQQAAAAQAAAAQAAAAQAAAAKPGVNLADGLDIAEIAQLASQFLGGSAQQPQVQQQPVVLQQPVQQAAPAPAQAAQGIDFGTIAQIASVLLKK